MDVQVMVSLPQVALQNVGSLVELAHQRSIKGVTRLAKQFQPNVFEEGSDLTFEGWPEGWTLQWPTSVGAARGNNYWTSTLSDATNARLSKYVEVGARAEGHGSVLILRGHHKKVRDLCDQIRKMSPSAVVHG